MDNGYDANQNGYGYIKTDILQTDSRAERKVSESIPCAPEPAIGDGNADRVPERRDVLRSYLVRYARWAVLGDGTEPEKPPCLRRPDTAPRLRETGR